jgi:VWFA-related protein
MTPAVRICLVGAMLGMATLIAAPQDRPAPQAPFRSGVDLIELDVSVLDRARQPVRGLTADDFTVRVDGESRPIRTFSAVDIPPPLKPSAPWIRDMAPDVATNTRPGGRVVVIMIDDGSFGQVAQSIDMWAVQKARAIARAAVDELRPNDLAAVVFTENNHAAQNFTNDRQRLLRAIEKAPLVPGSATNVSPAGAPNPQLAALAADPDGSTRGSCNCGLCSIDALGHVAQSLISIAHQRKILVYVSAGVVVTPDDGKGPEKFQTAENWKLHCNLARRDSMSKVFRQLQRANVMVQAIDPKGVVVSGPGPDWRVEFLRTVAETTGGRAIVNHNEMETMVPAVMAESSAYYLLAVDSGVTKDDGRFHPIEIRVNRPDVEVRSRKGYFAPTANDRKAMTAAAASPTANGSIEAALPKSDFPLDVSAVPIAGGSRKPEVAIVLGVTQTPRAAQRAGSVEPIDVLVRAFDPDSGGAVGSASQKLTFTWNTLDSPGQLEVLSRLPLRPGRYELRVGVNAGGDRSASVYTYADVPDFAREPLTLSGLVVSTSPAPKSALKGALSDLMPVVPTARRVFRDSDRVTVFVRVFQGGGHALESASIATRVIDTANAEVGRDSKTADAKSFGANRSFDYTFDLPVRDFAAGQYLLTMDVSAGSKKAQRTLRFRIVRPPS